MVKLESGRAALMKVSDKICLECDKAYNKIRNEVSLKDISDEEVDKVRLARLNLQKQGSSQP